MSRKSNGLLKIKNVFIYIMSFAASGCGILLNFVLAKFLEAEQFGQLQYFVALSTTISQILIFGLSTFLIREAKNERQNGEVFNKCISIYLSIVLFFLPIIYFVLKNIVLKDYSESFLITSITIVSILMGLNSLITSYFQGSGKLHLTIIFENLIPKFVLLTISCIFIALSKTKTLQENYLTFYIVIYGLVAIPFLIYLFKKINFSFSKGEIKSIFCFFGVTITYSLGNNLTKVLQGGLYKNDVVLGIISVSLSIVGLVRVFTNVLDNLMKPIFSKMKRNNDINGLIESYRFDTRVNSYVSIPLYLFFIIHPLKFLSIFGASYTSYPLILVIIALSSAVTDITGPLGTVLSMTGKEKWELINGFIYFAIYIAGVFIFSFDKIYGLTISLLVAQLGVNLAKFIETWLIYKIFPINWKTIITMLIVLLTNFAIVFVFRLLNVSLIVWVVLGIIGGILCVVINFFVVSLYRKKDFKTLLSIKL